ncbi:hypothetical protein IVB03_08020 [Bradyrhizobium sp. 168]|jgi:hypothetical protein|uniref:hypothetical protein n=1 Tax=unclassified Bradyrhizobium TaxID=2631580 RepID=UPI001FFA145C|nr:MULTISPECIES: hypothetical protein [unclassified Bradyrhizobium]MCK1579526.1 hypothetical protein [Bradyrhizobium sp. 168]MCK1604952.1 hypothetical protein [Bradyrhizobium sp. 166]
MLQNASSNAFASGQTNFHEPRPFEREALELEGEQMKAVPRLLVVIGLAVTGWLGPGLGTAFAQRIYLDPYPAILPPAITYVVRRPIVEPPAAIVRERTVVVRRPVYVPAPV